MFSAIFVIHILICIGIIALVLLQQGEGAEAGALFGSNSDSVLGASGASSFISKFTTAMAIAFMITSVLLVKAYMGHRLGTVNTDVLSGTVMEQVAVDETTSANGTATVEGTASEDAAAVQENQSEPAVVDAEVAKGLAAEGAVLEDVQGGAIADGTETAVAGEIVEKPTTK